MSEDEVQAQLVSDLESVGERFSDEKFSTELYRALARNTWSRRGGPEGHVALSFAVAEEVVNAQRERVGAAPLTLAQTGGEGEVSSTVSGELDRLGWTHRPLNTARGDEQHVGVESGTPPRRDDSAPEWERQAHDEAERGRS